MNDQNKTPEELRMEMYRKLSEQQGKGEHLCEFAMPGVCRPVDENET